VADIDRGGVFAQIIGTVHLMSPKEKALTAGFLINKFRGDPGLFASGIDYIQEKTQRPVYGLVPFVEDIALDWEDSVAVQEDRRVLRSVGKQTVNIGVLRLPAISNFTDLRCLETEPNVVVNYLFRPQELTREYDGLILPGTKNVMEDAAWLARTGWKTRVRRFADAGGHIIGICGGYQLLGDRILDPYGVESLHQAARGLGLLPIETVLEERKVVRKVAGTCLLNSKRIRGYEIHMGRSRASGGNGRPYLRIHEPGLRRTWEDGWSAWEGRVAGTYVHGLMDSPGFRCEYLNGLRRQKGLKPRRSGTGTKGRLDPYDRLADHFESHCDVGGILSLL
jgi:adenosylcobyric acid synthase